MELANTISGLTGSSIQAIVDQAMQAPMPMWEQSSLAQLTSTQAAQTADGRVDAVIQSMSAMQSWAIGNDLADSANAALGSVLGSTASLGELMSVGIVMLASSTQVTDNSDGTVTVTTTTTHDPGVNHILEQFTDYSAAPAGATGDWLAALLSQRGEAMTDNLAAFSASLPGQVLDFVQAGAASSALGAALVIDYSAYY